MKGVLIAILLLIVLPTLVLGGLYFFVEDFQLLANEVLGELPGGLGDYFSTQPTRQETNEQISQIANYLLDLELQRTVDKLNLIENEDQTTYDLVIKSMLRMDPNRTEKVLEEKRRQSLSSDVVKATLDLIKEEETADYKDQADFLTKIPQAEAIEEVKNILDNRVDAYDYLYRIFEQMSDEKVSAILPFLSPNDQAVFEQMLTQERALAIKVDQTEWSLKQDELAHVASLLQGKSAKELSELIGPQTTYPLEELVVIYETLGPKRSGEVLSKLSDDAFVLSLVSAIKDHQKVLYGEDKFTSDMMKSLSIYKKFDDNISELVEIYSKVDDQKTAEIIKKLYWNTGEVKTYPLDNGELIEISDQALAIQLLKSFSTKKIASVLSFLDNTISTELSTKLALPE